MKTAIAPIAAAALRQFVRQVNPPDVMWLGLVASEVYRPYQLCYEVTLRDYWRRLDLGKCYVGSVEDIALLIDVMREERALARRPKKAAAAKAGAA